MKKVLIVVACAFFSFGTVKAQSNKEDVDLIQAAFGKEKKDLVSEYMMVKAKDSVAFWKLYDEYEGRRKALGTERIKIIENYANHYDNLTDAKAAELARAALANDGKYVKLHSEYFEKFAKTIGGKGAAKLFQLETYLQTIVKAHVMDQIPFIGQLDKTKVEGTQQ